MVGAIMVLLLLAAGLLQSAIPAAALLGSAKIPLLWCVVLHYALAHSRPAMLTAAVLAGVVQDASSLMPLGYSALGLVVLGLAIQHNRDLLFRESLATGALLGGLGSAALTLALYALMAAGDWGLVAPWWWVSLKVGGQALLGCVAAPVVLVGARALDRLVGIEIQERL